MTGQGIVLLENFFYTSGIRRRHCLMGEVDRDRLVSATCGPDLYRGSTARAQARPRMRCSAGCGRWWGHRVWWVEVDGHVQGGECRCD